LPSVAIAVVLAIGAGAIDVAWVAPGEAQESVASVPSAAESIYAAAPPRLLQIRTLVVGSGRQFSIGSGFLVTADGLAVTNYHVVSQVALEPKTYRLEYAGADGSSGEVKLLAIDLPNDLAVVHLDKRNASFFAFDEAAMARGLAKGERLYSMGNPLDLGFTINEGTYNGLVERSYNERIHFTGALNPGMSGGPTVTTEGLVIGINVAKRVGGELVSFLVPAHFAAALLQRVRDQEMVPPADFRAEIGRQFGAWQAGLYKSFAGEGFRSTPSGHTGRPSRKRRGSIAGPGPMPGRCRSPAPASKQRVAGARPTCTSPMISTPGSYSSAIPMSGPSTSISSSSRPS